MTIDRTLESMGARIATATADILVPQVGTDVALGIRASARGSFSAGLELGLSFAIDHPREARRVLAEIEVGINPDGRQDIFDGRLDLERQLLAASRSDA